MRRIAPIDGFDGVNFSIGAQEGVVEGFEIEDILVAVWTGRGEAAS